MLSLYRIKEEYLASFRELSQLEELTEEMIKDSLVLIEDQFEEKALAVAAYIKNVEAESKALADHVRTLQARKGKMENSISKLKRYLVDNMKACDKIKIKGQELDIGLRHNAAHLTRDYTIELDPRFIKVVQSIEEDEDALKKALEAGEEIKGAQMVSTISLIIR